MMALGPARLRTLEALADALIPPGGPLPGGAEVGTAARAAELLARMPGLYRRALTAELTLLERLSIAGPGRRSFSRLSRAEREQVLARVDRSPGRLGEAAIPLKLLTMLAYLGQPSVARALGVEPGPFAPLTGPLPAPARLPVRAYPEVRPGTSEVVDVVVVGSGAGGAPVARTLAEAGWSVAVVEEGSAYTREDFRGPELDRMQLLYRGGGATFTFGRPSILMPIGRAVGGSTVGNSGTCFRTPDRVVAGWRSAFGVELSPEELEPFYADVERTLGVAPVPWEVMGNNGLIAHRGASALGIPGRPLDRNGEGCHGSGVCTAGCPVDGKRGVHLNYLPAAVAAGAEIFSRCRVERLLTRGGRAVGVEVMLLDERGRPAGDMTLHARRGVVVAAGAPLTPGLLARSGHRGASLGRNLRIHPAGAVAGLFDEDVHGWRGVMQSYLIDALASRGVMLEATFPPPSLGWSEAGLELPAVERKALLGRLRNMAVLGVLVSDESSGRVTPLGRGRMPLMTYRMGRPDTRRMREGMALAAKVLFAAGATEVFPTVAGLGTFRTPADAEQRLRADIPAEAFRLTAYHPMGTVRMGADPGGLVDGEGRVRGAERLVVADASVFPTSLGVNPQVTIMAFASRAAEAILRRW